MHNNDHINDTVLTAVPEHTSKVAFYWIIIIIIIDGFDILHTCFKVGHKRRRWLSLDLIDLKFKCVDMDAFILKNFDQ